MSSGSIETIMLHDLEVCAWPECDDLSAMLAVTAAIPDGIRLAEFPTHCVGPACWCRPQVAFVPGEIVVYHKNLDRGEFDS